MPNALNHTWKRHIPGVMFSVAAWIFAIMLLGFIRTYGVSQNEFRALLGVTPQIQFWGHLVAGALIGSTSGIVNILLDIQRVRRLPFGVTILVKSLAFGVIFVGAFVLTFLLIGLAVPQMMNFFAKINEPVVRSIIVVASVYAGVVNLVVDFVRQVDRKLGPGELLKFITGRYHKPREEERIFMFLDLRSSTSHAERLGHIRYSRLLQDCFFDLTDVVTRYGAEVYQYVGDEVILTWRLDGGAGWRRFIEARFAFRDILAGKSEYYRSTYGFLPEFKTGAHVGRVTVAEVGEIKREIAFHGDVLNTASRITGKCGEVGAAFLVSDTVLEAVGGAVGYAVEKIGDVDLRGKRRAVSLFSVDRAAAAGALAAS